jgi:hypothetical protein
MVRISLEFDDDPDDLDAAARLIEAIQSAATPPTVPAPPATAPASAWNVAGWFNHLGPGSRSFWEIAARHATTHPRWTFDDLSEATGVEKETLRSYQRNSYRAIKAEKAPDPLDSEWDANRGCNVYTLKPAVGPEILRLAGQN